MTASEAIHAAISTVGEQQGDDYVISPTHHAEVFRDAAPTLAAILSASAVETTAQQYEILDRDALEAQNQFKRVFSRANVTVLMTGVLVALILATGAIAAVLTAWLVSTLLVVLSLASVVTGALASKDLLMIKQGQLLEDWMSKRALAETTRLDYFEQVAKSTPSAIGSSMPTAPLLQLEYFRRFQLDAQLTFYSQRGKAHREEAASTLSYSGWAAAGAAIAAGAAGVLGASVHSSFAAIGALGAVCTGVSAFAAMREAVHQDRRNAERYARTHRVLVDLRKRLDEVRSAVYTAGMPPLSEFVDAVYEQLSLEHRQWLGELGEARGAFARLDSTLKALSEQAAPPA
jgi:hypothetical protein